MSIAANSSVANNNTSAPDGAKVSMFLWCWLLDLIAQWIS